MRFPRAALLAVVLALTVMAMPAATAAPVGGRDVSPGGLGTDNVEWLGHLALNSGTPGARIVDKYMYATDDRGLTIYDISKPELPVPTGFAPAPQTPVFVQEDVETNGRIVVIASNDVVDERTVGQLFVYDVQNKNVPKLIGTSGARDVPDHTITCALDCTWIYGSGGTIVDLRDPTKPKVAGSWFTSTGGLGRGAHDLTEVEPGLLMVASNPLVYLDVRQDPTKPKVIGAGILPDRRFIHDVVWPQGGNDRFLLAGGETFGNCSAKTSGAFMTFDARGWGFQMVDEYRVPATPSSPVDGGAPRDFYCAHWFSPKPDFANGGIVAMGWYEHGVRFLEVGKNGKIAEKGWFIGAGAQSSAAYWVTDQIVYVLDYNRGLDILRFHDRPATGTKSMDAGVPLRPPVRLRQEPSQPGGAFSCPIPL